ncbi:hypothetical protein MRX96_017247 [Rhipicephalus microplus]
MILSLRPWFIILLLSGSSRQSVLPVHHEETSRRGQSSLTRFPALGGSDGGDGIIDSAPVSRAYSDRLYAAQVKRERKMRAVGWFSDRSGSTLVFCVGQDTAEGQRRRRARLSLADSHETPRRKRSECESVLTLPAPSRRRADVFHDIVSRRRHSSLLRAEQVATDCSKGSVAGSAFPLPVRFLVLRGPSSRVRTFLAASLSIFFLRHRRFYANRPSCFSPHHAEAQEKASLFPALWPPSRVT